MNALKLLQTMIRDKFKETGTDKHIHGYHKHYAKLFDFFQIDTVLEIGILHGWSLISWRNIVGDIPNKTGVYGIDIRMPLDTAEDQMKAMGIHYLYGVDSVKKNRVYDPAALLGKRWFSPEEPLKWSLSMIVDDGSHKLDDQIATFKNFRGHWRHCYVIEDVLGPENLEALGKVIKEFRYDYQAHRSERYANDPTKELYMVIVYRPGTGYGNAYS